MEWSIRRALAVRQFRGESRGYFVPVHLTSRAAAPDLVAPVQVQSGRVVVRALIEPRDAYPTARAVVERRDLLQAWWRTRAKAPDLSEAVCPWPTEKTLILSLKGPRDSSDRHS